MTIPKSTATSRSYLLSLQAIALFPSEETHTLFALTAPEDMSHNNPKKPLKPRQEPAVTSPYMHGVLVYNLNSGCRTKAGSQRPRYI